MSTLIENLFAEPVSPGSHRRQVEDNSPRPSKRRRSSLFLQGSDDEDEDRPIASNSRAADIDREEVDALFAEIDDENITHGSREKETDSGSFDVEAYRREARRRANAAADALSSPRALQSSSPPPPDTGAQSKQRKSGTGDDEVKERKPIPKLDETRLLGKDGFPSLIRQTKGFKPKGKGHELSDLNRVMQIYQFWAHKMFPKMQFGDTVDRVEKLCRSRRMQVALGGYKDEAKGTINGVRMDDPSDDAEDVSDGENRTRSSPTSMSAPQSENAAAPPSSPSEGRTDDDFDMDTIFADPGPLENTNDQPTSKAPSTSSSNTQEDDSFWEDLEEHMDHDIPANDASTSISMKTNPSSSTSKVAATVPDGDDFWADMDEALGEDANSVPSATTASAQLSTTASGITIQQHLEEDGDDELWNIMDEMGENAGGKQGAKSPPEKPPPARSEIPHVNEGSATNDEDWEGMYA